MRSSGLLLVLLGCLLAATAAARSFTINGNDFVKDGEPFRIVSGSFHYWRTLPDQWADRMARMKAGGLNTLETYVAWNLHEPRPGVYDFEGPLNLLKFIEIANATGLLVIVRPPPYICAEWEFGGLPAWLQESPVPIQLRTADPLFLAPTISFLNVLLTMLEPLQYSRGGPIIAMQVENEYGSYGNDTVYMNTLYQAYLKNGIDDTVLFMSNGGYDDMMEGALDNLLRTVNFGSTTNATIVSEQLDCLRKWQPTGPLFVTEFWDGWFDHWGDAHWPVDPQIAAATLDQILAAGASVNMYMYVGGTNFGFMAGANYQAPPDGPGFQAVTTSYDYGAPVSESGDVSPKWAIFKQIISKYVPVDDTPQPPDHPKGSYGTLSFSIAGTLLDNAQQVASQTVTDTKPWTFADLKQSYGYVLYQASFMNPDSSLCTLKVQGLNDSAHVIVDGVSWGVLNRNDASTFCEYPCFKKQPGIVNILVHNQARINYGPGIMGDIKGILSATSNNLKPSSWISVSIPMDSLPVMLRPPTNVVPEGVPCFFEAFFTISGTPADTFIDTTGLGVGVLWVNGFNVGRYDASTGPQVTLYIPASVLKQGVNRVVVFDTVPKEEGKDLAAVFVTAPAWNK